MFGKQPLGFRIGERLGSAMPEQVTTTQNSPVDRGLSCIPLFGLGRLGAFYVANPLLPLRLSARRSLTQSLYES